MDTTKYIGRLFLLAVCLTSLGAVSAQADEQKIEKLIKDDLKDNSDEIRELAGNLDSEKRRRIYLKYEQPGGDAGISALVNYFPGFGLGSYAQGDMAGGFVLTLGHVAAVSMIIIGAVQSNQGHPHGLVWGGVVSGGVIAIAGLVRPFFYRISYNERLRKSLGTHYQPAVRSPVKRAHSEYRLRFQLASVRF